VTSIDQFPLVIVLVVPDDSGFHELVNKGGKEVSVAKERTALTQDMNLFYRQ
jgi:hypothetical protein